MLKTILKVIECVAILGLITGFIILDHLFGDKQRQIGEQNGNSIYENNGDNEKYNGHIGQVV